MPSELFDGAFHRRLIENITLLYTLTEVPEQPTENQLTCAEDGTQQFTAAREMQLADTFAFISATTADMFQVTAVCIEEDRNRMGMTVRLASNSGDLSSIATGLKEVANTLEEAALRSMHDLTRAIMSH